MAVGIGSTAYTSGDTALVSETDRNQLDSSDLGTAKEITFTANWAPLDISGTILKELGTMTLGSTIMNREVLAGSAVFDGEAELQIQQTFKFYI